VTLTESLDLELKNVDNRKSDLEGDFQKEEKE
jgi:hypothetical protein